MPETLLRTKLFIPPLRPHMVPRQRLIERLNHGLQHGSRLTLISAPAGFGKTSLVGEWIAGCEQPVAWLSPDEDDNDLRRFLTYVVAAVQTVVADFGEGVLELLQSSQASPDESVMIALINEISTIPQKFILVLDDYHVIDTQPVDDALALLLEHLPAQMHLVITTREDPNLPLARLRARGQLTELRVADLRFAPDEAATFLNEVMGLNLSAQDIAALETRTEGWIAGLQMAALSMQGRSDTARFIQAFTGSHRFVMDYLVDEVLQRQPEHVRSFLLQTSILDRLSSSLCDTVTGNLDSQEMLETLERSNLLIVPLDDRRHWYRYHHLFAGVLQARLMMEQPERLTVLHHRASKWYEDNGSPADAVRHALETGDFERTADLVEIAWPAMNRRFQDTAWLGWVNKLPQDLVRARPVLSLDYAWALLNTGQLEAAEPHLRNAEQWLDLVEDLNARDGSAAGMVVVDEEQFLSLPASLATARAYHAQALGNVPDTVRYGRRALELLPGEEYLQRGIVAAILGLAYLTTGDLEAAHDALAGGMANMQTAGNVLFAMRGTYILADIRMAQGRLRDAVNTYEQLLRLASQQGERVLRGTADLHMRLSELYVEQDNLEAARELMLRGEELGKEALSPIWRYRLCLAQARTKKARGDFEGALDLLEEAERRYVRTPVPDMYPVGALKARVWIAQSSRPAGSPSLSSGGADPLARALGWVREEALSADDDLSYRREFEHITLARLLIAQYQRRREEHILKEAMDLLERLLQSAEAGGRMGSAIEILILQALAHQAQGSLTTALAPLARALALAEPEGYVRIFVDEGAPMAQLLTAAAGRQLMPVYTTRLLAAYPPAGPGQKEPSAVPSTTPHLVSEMVEPLSPRELEVLQLINQGLSNRQIAERLFLALSTVKGHNRRIFGKLGVHRRTEAVARARELGLL